jgi:hypothetical protein
MITVTAIRSEKRNSGWDSKKEVLYSGPVSPRRLLKAMSIARDEAAYHRKIFGPSVISPKLDVVVSINGKALDWYDYTGLAIRLSDPDKQRSATEICAEFITRFLQ